MSNAVSQPNVKPTRIQRNVERKSRAMAILRTTSKLTQPEPDSLPIIIGSVSELASLLRLAKDAHSAYEHATPQRDHSDWPEWYAGFIASTVR